MNPVALTLDILLASLLLITLGFGLRLDKRLKTLNATQESFKDAVAELDEAAARAERGLADLHRAVGEAAELLAGRIEKARDLAVRLDRVTAEAKGAGRAAPPQPAPAAPVQRRAAAEPGWMRPVAAPPVQRPLAAEPLTLTRGDSLELRRPAQPAPLAPPRSRAPIDDDLFDAPGIRRRAGGR